ncbi:ROK family protein [Nocardioides sp. GXZ039]|uniref:ROK family protein n=1 Tax=Nocardioides sp. GXZ039 TaxID=3136018 RepID=UPI0030F3A74B
MVLYIGVDVGGTKVLAGEVTRAGTVVRTARRSTPGRRVDISAVEDALTEAVLDVAGGRRIAGVGLAAAGFVDAAGERVMFAPHLPWAGERVRERLSKRWGAPVALDNDANCAAVAETAFGVVRGASSALMITLGTGIGGAIVLAGQLVRGAQGMAGEFGHMQLVPDGRNCECGMSGCWEQYCSGNALVRFARAHLDGPDGALLRELCGGDLDLLTGPMVTEAAERGDPLARQAFAVIGEWLGAGLGALTSAFDPELIVVGGGVSAAGDILLDPARQALARTVVGAGHRTPPQVTAAGLGPEAGLIGAALLARSARWAGSARTARTARSVRGIQTIGPGDYRSGVIKPRRRRPGRGARGTS